MNVILFLLKEKDFDTHTKRCND